MHVIPAEECYVLLGTQEIGRLIEEGALKITVDKAYPLAEVAKAQIGEIAF